MPKRRSIGRSTFDSLLRPSEVTAASRFTVNGGVAPEVIDIPTPIAHRLFYLGRAYGSRTLSQLSPGVRVVIGSVDVHAFRRDLKQVLAIVNDEILHGHINALIAALEHPPGISSKSVAAFVGGVDEKRA